VADRLFADPVLAELYDRWDPWQQRADFRFYLPLVMSARAVLDVGCGTGELLGLARQAGYTGRLCGLDPAPGMLQQARQRPDIEWVAGDAASASWDREFDLAIMTGHAFQALVEDDDIANALAAIRAALTPVGRFAFETRHPLARAWENWTPASAVQVIGPAGSLVRMTHEVRAPFDGRTVTFTSTFTSPGWDSPEVSQSTLRFLDAGPLSLFLSRAGLIIEEQFGDWDRQPLTAASPEIITIARPA
jgi:SAM-dependent methyltransferase